MDDVVSKALDAVNRCQAAYTKFISPNDAGKTGGHQSGFYISRPFLPHIFERSVEKGNDYEHFAGIKWQGDFETTSRFKYYGSKNECHLTRFGKGFPFLNDNSVGNLLVLCKFSIDYYEAYILQTDDELEEFFAAANISPTETNTVLQKVALINSEEELAACFSKFLKTLNVEFPPTLDMAIQARSCYNQAFGKNSRHILANPDEEITRWLAAEYDLFKVIENHRYQSRINTPFRSVEELVSVASSIINRRKNRAGSSLEHHLAEIFKTFGLAFQIQTITEDRKRPDFIFPSIEAYLNPSKYKRQVTILASKTTCKDRWRQVINEADNVRTKHLFTLQQGVSQNQMKEMSKYGVVLVVPVKYHNYFPKECQKDILTLQQFVSLVRVRAQ